MTNSLKNSHFDTLKGMEYVDTHIEIRSYFATKRTYILTPKQNPFRVRDAVKVRPARRSRVGTGKWID